MSRTIAVYMRVSTGSQDHRSQEPDLKRWLAAFAGVAPVTWYRDKSSGATMQRPAWDQLLSELRAGRIERLVVWRLDRLGRTALGLHELFVELERLQVGLVSIRDGIDLATPAGRMLAGVLASIAQFEREVSRERQAAGIAAAKAAGRRWGGGVLGRRWKVTEEIRLEVRRMKAAGSPVAAIARITKLSRDTVYDVLKSDTVPPAAT